MPGDEWLDHDAERAEHEPWHVLYGDEPSAAQRTRHAELGARPGYHLDPTAYVASGAHVVASRFTIGAYSQVAAGCVIRGDVTIGEHCSLNAGAVTIGKVTLGEGVRVASYAVLVGENHVVDDLDTPIWLQGLTTEGVVIGDDVWIGANATVVDGVTVGAHSVVAAGAVVTRDVAPWSVVAGVPARLVRDRRDGAGRAPGDRLGRFADAVAEQWPDTLARCEAEHDGVLTYVDTPGADWGPRPLNDAIEIAGAFGAVPPVGSRDELIARLQQSQDPDTGMFVDPRAGMPDDPLGFDVEREWDLYGYLSVGYALEVLGSGPAHPVHVVERLSADDLFARLDRLDFGWFAWPSGSWIDGVATAIHLNRRHHGSRADGAALFGWLATHQGEHGMWGRWLEPTNGHAYGWLMAVNGFYRLTRGTYAQFGLEVPRAERAIDTVLAHGRDFGWFGDRERTACNVLDVVHPLWLLGRQTDHRRAEIRDVMATLLAGACDDWVAGHGFAFEAGGPPGLQGTEMWLSIVHLVAAALGEHDGLPWTPRGVHRLEPASPLF